MPQFPQLKPYWQFKAVWRLQPPVLVVEWLWEIGIRLPLFVKPRETLQSDTVNDPYLYSSTLLIIMETTNPPCLEESPFGKQTPFDSMRRPQLALGPCGECRAAPGAGKSSPRPMEPAGNVPRSFQQHQQQLQATEKK